MEAVARLRRAETTRQTTNKAEGDMQTKGGVRVRSVIGKAARSVVMGLLVAGLATGSLAACSSGKKKHAKESPPKAHKAAAERERIPVLTYERALEPDPELARFSVILPPPWRNRDWPVAGGSVTNAMYHVDFPRNVQLLWKRRLAHGGGMLLQVTPPVVADGRLFLLDSRSTLVAADARSGRLLWRRALKPRKEKAKIGFGGGVAVAGDLVIAATGFGELIAFDAATGKERWRHRGVVPLRGSPAVAGGRVFALTMDNQIIAVSLQDGQLLWTQSGLPEDAALLGAATAAIAGDTAVFGLSSGELFALRAANGQLAWQDTLSRTGRLTPLATLADIDSFPVIDRGRVYAVSHAGRMVAIDLRSGERLWEQDVASTRTPWVAGDYIFLVTADAEVVALSSADGRVRWVTRLERFADPKKRKNPVVWSGPVLAGDRLIVVSSNGFVLSLSPYTGEALSGLRTAEKIVAPPIVADGRLYLLSNGGEVLAYGAR